MGRLEGKIALITGASRGIGKATALLMAKEGARVIVADVLDKDGKALVADMTKQGLKAYYYHLDISSERQVRNLFNDVAKRIGKINVLVNNAGIAGVMKATHELSEKDWDAIMNINLKGTFFCTKYAVPQMKQLGGGSIINLSSIAGMVGMGTAGAYSASKGAIRVLTKNDAIQYAPDKIRVNSVHPGYIWTPMVQAVVIGEEAKKAADAAHPLGHMGEPEDIAYGILYLASDESKFMTGAELVIDGGYTAR